METKVPAWLDKTFLSSSLQEENGMREVTIERFSVTMAVPLGNNYTSYVYRVKVEYRVDGSAIKTISLIIKAPITIGIVSEMSDKLDLFSSEPTVYEKLLPKMYEKIQCQFGAKSYCCNGLKNGLVLQDLNEEGYSLSDRLKQLDLSHCKVAVSVLAKFHATSVALYKDDPDFIKMVGTERVYTEDVMQSWGPWMASCIKIVAGKVSDIKECKAAVDYFITSADKLVDSLMDIFKPKENGLNVLNHGDFWMGNMLFKHNDQGEVLDVKLVDFQIMRYASPVLDLIYFMWSSACDEVISSSQEDLFNTYLATLNLTLEKLGCEERLTKEEFKEDLRKSTKLAITTICSLLPTVLCEPENVIKSEDFKEEDISKGPNEKYLQIYNGKTFTAALPKVMKLFSAWIIHNQI